MLCLVLPASCQIRFSNLPGFNRSFLPVEMGEFCRKPISKTCRNGKNERKQQAQFPFVILPSNNDSWLCSCTLSSSENGISVNKLFTLGGRLFNPLKREHVLKRAECHCCEVNTFGIFACNFSTFFKVSQRD